MEKNKELSQYPEKINQLFTTRFHDAQLAPFCVSVPLDFPSVSATPLTPLKPGIPHNPPHYHDCFEMMWFPENFHNCIHTFNGENSQVNDGELHIIPLGHKHRILNVDLETHGIKVDFSLDFLLSLSDKANIRKLFSFAFLIPWIRKDVKGCIFSFAPKGREHINQCLIEMCQLDSVIRKHYFSKNTQDKSILSSNMISKFTEFLDIFNNYFTPTLSEKEIELCEKYVSPLLSVMEYINKNLSKQITLKEICDISGFGISWFSRIFREIFSFQVMDFVNFMRIYKARALLSNTPKHIHEIGAECGFNSTIYFDRIFKAYTGCTPKTFRMEFEYYLESAQ